MTPKPITQFVTEYFEDFGKAARNDYGTFTMVLFAMFATIAFGIFRGLAYATGLYAVLHVISNAVNGIINALTRDA